MNNRITNTFDELKRRGEKALAAFIIGGDPDIETTEALVLAMAEAGVDLIEIGIPFSDPVVAENTVMQEADARALAAGYTVDKLFDMVKRLREKTNLPLLFMTYANPIYAYDKTRFMAKCKAVGIDGIIVPDVPFEEKDEFEDECNRHDICLISLIAPTSKERAEKIAREAQGFLYCASPPGVAGGENNANAEIAELITQVKKVSPIPCMIGFGISTLEQARGVAPMADGAIVSSAVVQIIAEFGRESAAPVKDFMTKMKNNLA